MSDSSDPGDAGPAGRRKSRQDVTEEIGRKAARKLKARGRRGGRLWFGLGMFGLVGWAVAVPAVLGIAAGVWLDRHLPVRFSWTLTLLFIGVALGCMNAWYWVKRESRHE